jgi:hypothetical protein
LCVDLLLGWAFVLSDRRVRPAALPFVKLRLWLRPTVNGETLRTAQD